MDEHRPSCPFCEEPSDDKGKRLREVKERYFRGVDLARAAAEVGFDLSDVLAVKDKEAWPLAREYFRLGRFDDAKRTIREGTSDTAKLGRLGLMLEEIITIKLTNALTDPGSLKANDLQYLVKTLNELTLFRQRATSGTPQASPALRALETEQIDDSLDSTN